MSKKESFIVEGEASESDEEDYMSPVHKGRMKPNELVASIAGEDVSSEDDLNITISAFASKIEEGAATRSPQYESLFHKKLQESNWKFREGFRSFLRLMYRRGKEQVNEVNQKLLSTQVEAQETLKLMRNAHATSRNIDFALSSILSQAYVPETNAILIK